MTAIRPTLRTRHLVAAVSAVLLALWLVAAAPSAHAQQDPGDDLLGDDSSPGDLLDSGQLDDLLGQLDSGQLEDLLGQLDSGQLDDLLGQLDSGQLEDLLGQLDSGQLEDLLGQLDPGQLDQLLGLLEGDLLDQVLGLLDTGDAPDTPDDTDGPTGTADPGDDLLADTPTSTSRGQVDVVPEGGVATGPAAAPVGGGHAAAGLALFAGLTGAGAVIGRRGFGARA